VIGSRFYPIAMGCIMNSTLAQNWWLFALRGMLALLFGILAAFWPGLAWLYVVVSFAAFAVVDGAFAIAAAIRGQVKGGWWWAFILQGILGIAAGVISIFYPGLTSLALLVFIAVRAIFVGVFEIVAAIRLRREIKNEWALALAGVLSVLFGVTTLVMPTAGALAIAWLIAAYAIAVGLLWLTFAFRLRGAHSATVRQDLGRGVPA
jgi:uncharacterized membrane protein HdeD (DUF308 family)